MEIETLSETLELFNQYLTSQLEPMSTIEFFIQYVSPILQLIVIVSGSIAGLYKYFKSKNQEVYQRLLNEVYSPLYQYLVKQEIVRKYTNSDKDYKDEPFLELNTIEVNTDVITGAETTEKSIVLGLNRQELINVLDSINIGIASKELYTLLSMYKALVCLSQNYAESIEIKETQLDVEKKLRKEIISGYKKYHKKLGIKAGIENDFFEIKEDQIEFKEKNSKQCNK